jgi:hypothetical protein
VTEQEEKIWVWLIFAGFSWALEEAEADKVVVVLLLVG